MGRNDRVIVGLLGVLLALVLAIAWQIRALRERRPPSMSLTTEWTTPSGRIERFTSYRDPGVQFLTFNREHDQAVEDMGGPER